MKRIIFLLFLPVLLQAQLKVHADGSISAKSEEIPRAYFDIPELGLTKSIAQFGSFGIQANSNHNGFLTGNAYWDGSSIRAFKAGKSAAIQFYFGDFYIYNFPTTSSDDQSVGTPPYPVALFTKYDETLNTIVGINTSTPSGYNLYVNGTAYKASGGSSWAIPSDRRLKENIQSYKNATNTINKINIYEFNYNGKGGTVNGERSIGVIAQELKEIFPEMVKNNPITESDGKIEDYLSVESGNLIYVLIAAFNEQTAIINNLTNELEQIKAELEINSSNNNIAEED